MKITFGILLLNLGLFSIEAALPGILTHKMKVREEILTRSPFYKKHERTDYKQGYNRFNDPGLLLNTGDYQNNLNAIDKLSWTSGELEKKPWSDDYWPIYKGILGNRYADPMFAYKESWIDYFEYSQAYPIKDFDFTKGLDESLLISPSEKYDLLLGLEKGTLTKSMWQQGKGYYEQHGEVETWMGICHGWAPASFMEARPKNSFVLDLGQEKGKIKVFPADIKGLSSYVWSNSRYQTLFMGQRCNKKRPEGNDGRIISPECFDVNPGSFHLVTLNLISGAKESFVIDATYDYEVWNQPVFAYRYKYYHLITGKESDNWKDVRILKDDYKDPYNEYRSSNAKYLVGVKMEIDYSVENSPVPRDKDSEVWDSHVSAMYDYDLEIDSKGYVVGGEWHEQLHPDFLWRPMPGSFPQMSVSAQLSKILKRWDGKGPLPQKVQKLAQRWAREGVVLRDIVIRLIELSQ